MAEQSKPERSKPESQDSQNVSESAPKQDTAREPKKSAKVAHPAPSEYEGLPQGRDGGPATIDNPVAEPEKRK